MTDMVHSGQEASVPTAQTDGPAASVNNGPELWTAVLAKMPDGAIVAGGAVRDFLLGVEPKDIDVFCPTEALGAFDFTGFEPLGDDRRDEYEALPLIDLVQRTKLNGVQVDLVGVHMPDWTPRALVETFDFGITRSWFDAEGLHDTAEAGCDRASKTVTRLIHDRPERALIRFERFNQRMGGAFQYVAEGAAS